MITGIAFHSSEWLALLSLAVLLPVVLFFPVRWFLSIRSSHVNEREQADGNAIAITVFPVFALLLFLLSPKLGDFPWQPLLILVALGGVYGYVEDRYRLPSQITIPSRLGLVTLCYMTGFGFHLSEFWGVQDSLLLTLLLDYPPTAVFFLGLLLSVQVLDRLRGLAPGVLMIVSATLLTLILRWAQDGVPMLMMAIGGVCLGLLLIQGNRRKRLGRSAGIQLALLIGAVTIASRTWGFTLTMFLVPLIAIFLPMVDRIYFALRHFIYGRQDRTPLHLRSMLLDAGFSERWLVLFILIATLQIGVIVRVVYETKSTAFAVAAGLTIPMGLLFATAFLMRLGERLERRRSPDRLRVLFLSHYFPPEVNAPASRLYEHARRWTAAGHEVTVICPAPSAPHGRIFPGYENSYWREDIVDGIRVIRVWSFLAANRRRIRRTMNYVSFMFAALGALLLVRRHDVLVATTPQFFCGIGGALASLFRREKFILEVRDLWPDSIRAVDAGAPSRALDILSRMARWMYSRADCVVTVGPGYARELTRSHGVPPAKICVVPNGIDPDIFRELDASETGPPVLERYGLHDRFTVVYAGTLGLAHGLDVVLDAAEDLRERNDIAFLFVGDGAELERLRRDATRRKLDAVKFAGLLPKGDIPRVLAESGACLVHLRRRDLFKTVLPSKLFEAMSMARPVLLGVEGDARELLDEAGAGVPFQPENGCALAEAILFLADSPTKAHEMGERGCAFVRKYYTRDRFAKEYIAVMESLAIDGYTERLTSDEGVALPAEPKRITSETTPVARIPKPMD